MAARKPLTIGAFAVLFIAYQLPEGVGQRLLGSFLVQSALLLFFFLTAYIIGRSYSADVPQAYALENPTRWWRLTMRLFVLAIGLKLLSVAIGHRLGVFRPEQPATSTAPIPAGLLFALLITFVPSIAEDVVTRGFWFVGRGMNWGPGGFVVASSTIYVCNHVFRLASGPGEWVMLFTFGVAYALALVRSGSLWPAVGLHWGWNYGNAIAAALWPYGVVSTFGSRALAVAAHLTMAGLVITRVKRVDGTS